jgi:hypothetical protein
VAVGGRPWRLIALQPEGHPTLSIVNAMMNHTSFVCRRLVATGGIHTLDAIPDNPAAFSKSPDVNQLTSVHPIRSSDGLTYAA